MNDAAVPVAKHLRVEAPWTGLTVFDAVRRAFPELPPREVWRQARSGELVCDGVRCHPLDRVSAGEVLTLHVLRPPPVRNSKPTAVDQQVSTSAGPFRIVREDPDLLVVSKPSGCASHPAARHRGDTLIDRVRQYLGVHRGDTFQPALANRLDIDTSGLVLIAKSRGARRRLGRHLQLGKVRKWYVALVGGWPEPERGEVTVPLERHPDSRDLARLSAEHPGGRARVQEAHTRYRTLQRLERNLEAALLEVEILTGRTHQIRRHLTHIGLPIVGDRRYGDRGLNREVQSLTGEQRMFLHAHRVQLAHPVTGEQLELLAPLSAELNRVLQALGAATGADGPLDAGLGPG